MRKIYKFLALMVIVVAVIIWVNQLRVILFLEFLMASGYIWVMAGLIIIAPILYRVLEWFDVWSKLKLFSRGLKDKRIPQEKRLFEIMPDFIERNWKSRTAGKHLNLVNNYITPWREDSRPVEMALYTTSQAYAEKRISEEGIGRDQRFYVFCDCFTGECFTIDYFNDLKFQEAIQFINRYWFMGIKQKVETAMEKMMREAFARATGEEVAKAEISKQEKKDEEVKA